jgi:hypothetical protein
MISPGGGAGAWSPNEPLSTIDGSSRSRHRHASSNVVISDRLPQSIQVKVRISAFNCSGCGKHVMNFGSAPQFGQAIGATLASGM